MMGGLQSLGGGVGGMWGKLRKHDEHLHAAERGPVVMLRRVP